MPGGRCPSFPSEVKLSTQQKCDYIPAQQQWPLRELEHKIPPHAIFSLLPLVNLVAQKKPIWLEVTFWKQCWFWKLTFIAPPGAHLKEYWTLKNKLRKFKETKTEALQPHPFYFLLWKRKPRYKKKKKRGACRCCGMKLPRVTEVNLHNAKDRRECDECSAMLKLPKHCPSQAS